MEESSLKDKFIHGEAGSRRRQHGLAPLLFIIIALSILSVGPLAASDAPLPPLVVGCEDDYPPYCLVDERGQPMGFSVELIRAALNVMGRQASFVTGSWETVKKALENAEIQALPLVGRTPEREELFDFTFPYLTRYGTMVVRKGTTVPKEYADLAGKKVGVMSGDNAEEYVRRKGQRVDVVTTKTFEDALFLLAEGKIDAVVMQHLLAHELIAQQGLDTLQAGPAVLEDFKQSFCFAVTEGDRELLELLNEGLAITMANGTFDRLQEKWFSPSPMTSRGPLIIGGDENYPPYEFLDEEGQPAGFNVDLTLAIASELGIEVEIQLGPWNAVYQELKKGQIDMVQGLFYSPERDASLSFSQPHSVVDHVLVIRRDGFVPEDPARLKDLTLLVMEGDITHEFLMQEFPQTRLVLTTSQEEALTRLSLGEADAAMTARIPAYYWIEKNDFKNLRVESRPYLSNEYNYGALEENYRLTQSFTQGLSVLKATGRYHQIASKWLGVYEAEKGITGIELRRYLLVIILPLLVIMTAWFLWTRSLKHLVNQRTAELNAMTERLKDREAHFRNLFENMNSGVAVFQPVDEGRNFQIVDWNPAEEALRGLKKQDVLGKTLDHIYPDPEGKILLRAFQEVYTTAEPQILPITGYLKGLLSRWVEVRVFRLPSGQIVAISDDRTEQKRAEERLVQMEKMESIGQLAGGIAHDFNNQLSGILGYAELLLNGTQDVTLRKYIQNILTGAQNGARLTRQLLSFAQKGQYIIETLDLYEIIDEVVGMLEHTIDKRIEIVQTRKMDHPVVRGDRGQLQNALLNISFNARDALEGKGTITFETDSLPIEAGFNDETRDLAPGEYICITVSDDGCGMNEEVKSQIFEPFFTTKEVGQGTGMGLPAAYGAVKNHGGTIYLETAPGKGSSFYMLLPAEGGRGI